MHFKLHINILAHFLWGRRSGPRWDTSFTCHSASIHLECDLQTGRVLHHHHNGLDDGNIEGERIEERHDDIVAQRPSGILQSMSINHSSSRISQCCWLERNNLSGIHLE